MKRISKLLFFLLFMVSCAPIQTAPNSLPATPTLVEFRPTFTVTSPSPTFTSVPASQTATPQVCDPFSADFCITKGHLLFQRPIKPPANAVIDISYLYGTTARDARDPHHGVEFVNKFGTPVYAAGDGVVVFAGADQEAVYSPWPNFYGNLVVVKHADDLYTLYAHLSRITVEAGQTVLTGDQIGEVGQSGVAIGSHLHFEVRHADVEDYFSTENPELWLAPNPDENGNAFGVMEISIVDGEGHLINYTEFTAQFFLEIGQPSSRTYYGATYSNDMLNGTENAALGDMQAGYYRIVLKYNGQFYERWVEVESGEVTQVVIVVK
ncbi:MAG: M23 family metallopeptidase [Chloroflexota bacterium]